MTTSVKIRGEGDSVLTVGGVSEAHDPKYTCPTWLAFADGTTLRMQYVTAAPGLPGVWRATIAHYGTAEVSIDQFDLDAPPVEGVPYSDQVTVTSHDDRLLPLTWLDEEPTPTIPPAPVLPPEPDATEREQAPQPVAETQPAPSAYEPYAESAPAAPPAPPAPPVEDTPAPTPPEAAEAAQTFDEREIAVTSPVEEPAPHFPGADGVNMICRWGDYQGDLWLQLNGAALVPDANGTYRLDGTLFADDGPIVADLREWVGEAAIAWAARRTGMLEEAASMARWNPDPSAQHAMEFFALGQHGHRPGVRLEDGHLILELADGHRLTKSGDNPTYVEHRAADWRDTLATTLPFMASQDRLYGEDPTAVLYAVEAQMAVLQRFAIAAAERAVNTLNFHNEAPAP